MSVSLKFTEVNNRIVDVVYSRQINKLIEYIDKINAQYGAEVLNQINTSLADPQILSFLVGLIRNDQEHFEQLIRDSYYHENGFHKVVLLSGKTFKLRLHHFGVSAKQSMENIHDHRWPFSSSILYGNLKMDLFKVSTVSRGGESLYHFVYNSNKQRGSYEVEMQGLVFLNKISSRSYEVGQSYLMLPDDLHRIVTENGQESITLILTGKPQSEECNLYAKRPILEEEKVVVNYSNTEMNEMLDSILEKIYPQKN